MLNISIKYHPLNQFLNNKIIPVFFFPSKGRVKVFVCLGFMPFQYFYLWSCKSCFWLKEYAWSEENPLTDIMF